MQIPEANVGIQSQSTVPRRDAAGNGTRDVGAMESDICRPYRASACRIVGISNFLDGFFSVVSLPHLVEAETRSNTGFDNHRMEVSVSNQKRPKPHSAR